MMILEILYLFGYILYYVSYIDSMKYEWYWYPSGGDKKVLFPGKLFIYSVRAFFISFIWPGPVLRMLFSY